MSAEEVTGICENESTWSSSCGKCQEMIFAELKPSEGRQHDTFTNLPSKEPCTNPTASY